MKQHKKSQDQVIHYVESQPEWVKFEIVKSNNDKYLFFSTNDWVFVVNDGNNIILKKVNKL